MHNLQNLQNISGFNKKYNIETQTLTDYIKSLSGLVAYYPLDETSGNAINQAPDTIGSYDGVVTGATQGATGLVGNAYSFDGVGDKVVVAHDANLNFTSNKLTIFALVKQTGNNSSIRTFIKKNNSYLLRLETTSLNARFSYWNSTPSIKNVVDGVVDSNWHLILGRYDGSVATNNQQIFIDGSVVQSATQANENGSTATEDIGIGANATDASEAMIGLLQHVGIVKGALTDTQILRMAQLANLA